jgi:hypothetical protein
MSPWSTLALLLLRKGSRISGVSISARHLDRYAPPGPARQSMLETWKIAILIVSLGFTSSMLRAQDAAEYGASSGNSPVAVQTIKMPPMSVTITPVAPDSKKNTSPNLIASEAPPPAETNRKALERDSGKHPAKLLLRSTPGSAEVFVNDLTVGRAPVLLFVAPGKYKVGMRGDHQEWGEQTVGAMPDETQVVLIHLRPRYPSSVTLH